MASGRKTLLNKDLTQKLCEAISVGNYTPIACEYVGISYTTFTNWVSRADAELQRIEIAREKGESTRVLKSERIYLFFLERIKKAQVNAEVMAVTFVRTAMSTNWQAAMTFLERTAPDRWGRRDRSTQTKINIDAKPTEDYSQLSQEELDTLETLHRKISGHNAGAVPTQSEQVH